jgi:hypothetical protein
MKGKYLGDLVKLKAMAMIFCYNLAWVCLCICSLYSIRNHHFLASLLMSLINQISSPFHLLDQTRVP